MSSQTPRVAIVTGASQGIGLAIALRLAKDGLNVALNDLPSKLPQLQAALSSVEQFRGKDGGMIIVGDVSQEDDVKGFVEQVVQKWGALDVIVANAGIGIFEPFVDANIAEWERVFSVNIRGVMLCYKYAAIQMVKQGRGGRIIGAAYLGAYSASKFAVVGLTQFLGSFFMYPLIPHAAEELREHHITVNAYAPGVVDTDIVKSPLDANFGGTPGAALKKLLHTEHIKTAPPEAVASLVSYIASVDAGHVTGARFDSWLALSPSADESTYQDKRTRARFRTHGRDTCVWSVHPPFQL
ncbi:hypothetical protein PLICRDRAFT_105222 [Plicaturopsis crispa FD-325 SS-3]|nr:hypothetical protein PLICRDRAFT_105222 [Plicaturopsis crispa FD-325 SS-3]